MDMEGWTDAKDRPNYPHAKFCADQFILALGYARKQPKEKERSNMDIVKEYQDSHPLDLSYNRYCVLCGVNRLYKLDTVTYCRDCQTRYGINNCNDMCKTKEGKPYQFYDENKGLIWIGGSPDQLKKTEERIVLSERKMEDVKALRKEWEKMYRPSPQKETKLGYDPGVPEGDRTVIGVMEFAGGKVASSKCPSFQLIPTISLLRLVERFELGQQRKGDKAWNATTDQSVLLDRSWVMERLNHVIKHALDLRDKLSLLSKEGITEEERTRAIDSIKAEDDAAAIMWAGAFLIAATEKMIEERAKKHE